MAVVCHVCTMGTLELLPGVERLKGVTSDCKPWPHAAALGVCRHCRTVQKSRDAGWEATAASIYDNYEIYHQSAGAEQAVFDQASGQGAPRSLRLLRRLFADVTLPARGRLLDVGCGNGVLLRTAHQIAPDWTLAGHDLDERCREAVESIPTVERLYTGPLTELTARFDLITLQHVLEHIPNPRAFLQEAAGCLTPGGYMFIQVPNIWANPFDLMVADHATHYSVGTVIDTVRAAGLQTIVVADDWVPKELTVVAAVDPAARSVQTKAPALAAADDAYARAVENVTWLNAIVDDAAALAQRGRFGLLGTSIASTWLANMLGGAVQFFVDEDPSRVGTTFLERPVLQPAAVPAGAIVYLAFPPEQAAAIGARLHTAHPGIAWRVPLQSQDPALLTDERSG